MNQVADDPIDVMRLSIHERERVTEQRAPRSLGVAAERVTRPKWPALAVAVGIVLIAGAGGILVSSGNPTLDAPSAADDVFPTIGTSTTSYPPGHTSGWHVHPGVHSVVVLSGTMTVYDEHCVRNEYGAGQIYLGGSTPHLARNESPDGLDVAITFVYRPAADNHGTNVASPAGCNLR